LDSNGVEANFGTLSPRANVGNKIVWQKAEGRRQEEEGK
jgi:hypothetical protein